MTRTDYINVSTLIRQPRVGKLSWILVIFCPPDHINSGKRIRCATLSTNKSFSDKRKIRKPLFARLADFFLVDDKVPFGSYGAATSFVNINTSIYLKM